MKKIVILGLILISGTMEHFVPRTEFQEQTGETSDQETNQNHAADPVGADDGGSAFGAAVAACYAFERPHGRAHQGAD